MPLFEEKLNMILPELKKTMIPWLGKTGIMIRLFFSDKFKKQNIDMTTEQWLILRHLEEEDGRIQNDLAFITQRNKASLARLVSTMEKKNLVARIPSIEDKRANKVCLTKHGKKVFLTTLPIIHEAIKELQIGIEEHEIKNVISILQKVQQNIKESNDSCSTNY